VSFAADATGGVVHATINDPPEGLHRIQVDAKTMDMYAADSLFIPVFINRQNQAPIAKRGPVALRSQRTLDRARRGSSRDPDGIGFSRYTWRKVSGPGNMQIRYIGQEPNNQNTNQRRGDGVPLSDADGTRSPMRSPARAPPRRSTSTKPGITSWA